MMLGMGLGAIVVPSVAQRLVATLGWRLAYTVFGCSILLIPLPVVAAFLKERPENMGLLPDGAGEAPASMPIVANDVGLALREAVRTREFWTMVCSLFLMTASVHACFIHLPAILTDRGGSAQLAAFASSLFGVGLFMGRVGCGYLLDQFLAPRVAALLFSAVAIGIAFLGLGHAIWSACVAAVLTNGLVIHQALYAAAKIGVADLLKDGAQNSSDLARKLNVNESALYRILRLLASESTILSVIRQHGSQTLHLSALESGIQTQLRRELWLPLSFCDSSQVIAGDSRDSTLILEEARSSSSEDEATDMRQVCHPAGLHLRHSTCVEELTDKPKTD
jgi:hypothetical protein